MTRGRPGLLLAIVGLSMAACASSGPSPPASMPRATGASVRPPPARATASAPSSRPLELEEGACDRAYDHIEVLSERNLSRERAASARRDLEVNRGSFDTACAEDPSPAITSCVLAARSLDEAAACGATSAPSAPSPPPSEADCERVFLHLEDLTLAELPPTTPPDVRARARAGIEAHRDEVLHACVTDGTAAVVACVLRAQTIDQTDRCGR